MDQKIVQMVAQLLKSGVTEGEIIGKLTQNGIPEEIAKQAIAEAKEAVSGPEQAGKPEGAPSNSQGMAMMRQILTQVPPQVVLFIIEAITKMKGDELNALVNDLAKASQQGSAQAEEGQEQGGGSPASQQQQQQMQPQELQI